MIHCPYCGSEMTDDAKACPRCKSMLVEPAGGGPRRLPGYLHPFAAVAAVLALSAGLLAISLVWKNQGGPKPGPGPADQAQGEAMTAPEAGAVPGDMETPPPEADAGDEETVSSEDYDLLVEYENKVKEILSQADNLNREMNAILNAKDNSREAEFNEKLKSFQMLTNSVRNINPPAQMRRVHSRLANGLALRQRGQRNMLLFFQSGDMQRVERGRKDLERADQQLGEVGSEMARIMSGMEPPAPALEEVSPGMTAEPAGEVSPAEGGTQPSGKEAGTGREGGPAVEPPAGAAGAEGGPGPVDEEYLEEGDSLVPEDGGTFEGDELYPDEGVEEPYPGQEEAPYPEEQPFDQVESLPY